jgi:DNA repair protein RecO (recombination protein O)
VLRTTKYGEKSLIVTILTQDFGRISAIANDVRTKKSRMIAGLQLFAYSEIVMYKAKSKNGLYHLDEMTLIEGFSPLRTDLDKMAYASYFAECANGATSEEGAEEDVLRLLLNTLFALSNDLCGYEKIKTVFEWRLAAVSGYAPLLESCSGCGAKEDIFGLSLRDGTVFCKNCGSGKDGIAELSGGMRKVIGYITSADDKKIFSFDANEKSINYLSHVSEAYIAQQLERDFKTLDYLKKVKGLSDMA